MTLLRGAHRVGLQLALLAMLGGAAAGLTACDDGSVVDEDGGPGAERGEPEIRIFSVEPSATQGFAPFEMGLDVSFRTGDPVAEVEVEVDFGDGTELVVERTRTSLTPNATEAELVTPETRDVSLVHTYEEPGEYTVTVVVQDTTNSVDGAEAVRDEQTFTVLIEEQPDLIATSVSADVQNIEISEVFNVDFSVLNDGSAVSRGFFVQLLLVNSPDLRPEDLADSTTFVELGLLPTSNSGLARGASLSLSEAVQICDPRAGAAACEALRARLGEGMWYPAIHVDPPNALRPELNLQESNEANNLRVAPSGLTVAALSDLPDLTPRGIVGNPATTDVLTEVTVTFEVANIGEQDAPPTQYSIFLSEGDRTLDPADLPLGMGSVSPVSVGDSQVVANLSFPLDEPVRLPGEFWVLVRADDAAEVEERNETNNIIAGERAITVTGAQQSEVDLTPVDLLVTPGQTYVGGQFQVDFSVANLGADDPGTYQCALYLSPDDTLQPDTDSLLVLVGGENLSGGASDPYNRILYVSNFTPPGTYHVFVVCDPQQRIAESDETNNTIGPSSALVVNAAPQIDYEVQNLTVSASQITEGDDLVVEVDVCNQGIDSAGPVLVRAFLSPDGVIDPDDPVLAGKVTSTPALAPGACERVTLTGKIACLPFVDVYTVGVIVDPTQGVTEQDETNNGVNGPVDGLTVTGGQGSLCACVEDTPESGGDNDTQAGASAVTLSAGEPRTATLDPMALCDAVDFYTFGVDRGDTVTLTLTYDASIAPLGVRFYDPTEAAPLEVLDSAATGTLTLTEQVLGTSPQEAVYVEVFALTGGTRNYYTMDVSVSAAASEPELHIRDITLVTGTYPSILDPVEWDVTVFNSGLTDASSVQVTSWLSSNTTLDAGDLEVGSQVIATVGTIAEQTVAFSYQFPPGTPSGNYYVIARVDPMDTVVEVDETNNDDVSAQFTLDADCFADAFEGASGNDTFTDAYPLSPASGDVQRWDGLTVCNNGRDDYYLVCVPAGTPLRHIGAVQPNAAYASASEVTVYDLDQTSLGSATSTSADLIAVGVPSHACTTDTDCAGAETCNVSGFCADAAGEHCVYARVALRSTSSVISRPYSVIVDTAASNQLGEPTNDVRSTAVDFDPGLGSIADGNGKAAPREDSDWYYLDLEAGTEFTVHFETADDELRLLMYYPTTNYIDAWEAETITLSADQRVEFKVSKANTANTTDRPSAYRIRLEGLEGIDLLPLDVTRDVTEVAHGGSVLLSWDLTNERLTDTAQPVSYRYVVSADATLDAGDTVVDSHTVAGPDALSAISVQEKVYMTLPVDVFGDLHVFIDVDPGNLIVEVDETNNATHVPLTVRQLCLADAFEGGGGNESIATATPVSAPLSESGLTACGNDVDMYALTVPAGATYQFAISGMVIWSYGDLDLFLVDQNGVQLARSDALDTASEQFTWTNTGAVAKTVYLQVLPFRSDYTNVYDLSVVQQ